MEPTPVRIGRRADPWQTVSSNGKLMDDLDREIEEAARSARRRVWQGRLATIASTGAFLVIGIGGTIAMYQLFPDREEREFNAVRRENTARNGAIRERWRLPRLWRPSSRRVGAIRAASGAVAHRGSRSVLGPLI